MPKTSPRFIRFRLLGGRELAALAGLVGLIFLASALYVLWLPDVSEFKKKNPAETSFMRLKERQAAKLGRKLPRRLVWTPWSGISENLKHAVLVAEDDGFYRHKGVDWESTKKAIETDWKTRRFAKGGSTITQQVARNLYLSPSKNPLRKIKEILIARRLERELGKRRIFELYLNIAEWGKGIWGAEAAAQAYFGHSAAEADPGGGRGPGRGPAEPAPLQPDRRDPLYGAPQEPDSSPHARLRLPARRGRRRGP
ncbi:MAG: hypothetical protein A2X31_03135 [Elusimicrobia bacterium GWB2_63_22]|nr:MAG: hypothetical protein A2X31_03135 [Elusimicrobia bacterium GWB2_63_22]